MVLILARTAGGIIGEERGYDGKKEKRECCIGAELFHASFL